MTYILEIGDRRRLKRVSAFSPHRPSGTLLRWEAQFRRGTARNQCSALTVRGRHAVTQERESEGDGPPVLQVLPEGQKRAGTPASTAHTPVIRRQAAPAMPTEAGQAAPPRSISTAFPGASVRAARSVSS